MRIGGHLTVQDLPRGEVQPHPRWAARARLSRPRTRVDRLTVSDAELFELGETLDRASGVDALGPDHCLSAPQYLSRPFVRCKAANIVWTRGAKAIAAPGRGLIDDFHVGPAGVWPSGLIEQDLQQDAAGWRSRRSAGLEIVPGASIPLCHYGQRAFGHFVLDGLLQVYLHREALAAGEARLVHWPFESPWMEDLLTRCGAPASARRVLSGDLVLLETAHLSSALAGHGVYFPGRFALGFFDWLRGRLTDPTVAQPPTLKRLYVRRDPDDSRPVIDQDRLEAFLMARGFEILDSRQDRIDQQVQKIASAGLLLSSWGSGATLAPLLGGARQVVELTPESVTDPWFARQAAVHGLRYTPIIHPSTDGAIVPDLGRIAATLDRLTRG